MRLLRRRGGRGGRNGNGIEPQKSEGEEKGNLSLQRGNERGSLVEAGGSPETVLLVDHRPTVSLVVAAERARMGWLICRKGGTGCWIDQRRELLAEATGRVSSFSSLSKKGSSFSWPKGKV